eukprot:352209-Hanusia_phi.AAC.8
MGLALIEGSMQDILFDGFSHESKTSWRHAEDIEQEYQVTLSCSFPNFHALEVVFFEACEKFLHKARTHLEVWIEEGRRFHSGPGSAVQSAEVVVWWISLDQAATCSQRQCRRGGSLSPPGASARCPTPPLMLLQLWVERRRGDSCEVQALLMSCNSTIARWSLGESEGY